MKDVILEWKVLVVLVYDLWISIEYEVFIQMKMKHKTRKPIPLFLLSVVCILWLLNTSFFFFFFRFCLFIMLFYHIYVVLIYKHKYYFIHIEGLHWRVWICYAIEYTIRVNILHVHFVYFSWRFSMEFLTTQMELKIDVSFIYVTPHRKKGLQMISIRY
jgi:hypothetical protein